MHCTGMHKNVYSTYANISEIGQCWLMYNLIQNKIKKNYVDGICGH